MGATGMPISAGELETSFNGLGAAITKERTGQSRQRCKLLGKLSLQRVIEEIRTVNQGLGLVGDRGGQTWIGMSQCGNANTGDEVEVLAALRIVDKDALAADEHDWCSPIGGNNVPRLELLNRFGHILIFRSKF
jgi:hypothetical protein